MPAPDPVSIDRVQVLARRHSRLLPLGADGDNPVGAFQLRHGVPLHTGNPHGQQLAAEATSFRPVDGGDNACHTGLRHFQLPEDCPF